MNNSGLIQDDNKKIDSIVDWFVKVLDENSNDTDNEKHEMCIQCVKSFGSLPNHYKYSVAKGLMQSKLVIDISFIFDTLLANKAQYRVLLFRILILAIKYNRTSIIDHLLNQRIDIFQVLDHGKSVLYYASKYGHLKLVKELIRRDIIRWINCNITSNNSNTPFRAAMKKHHRKIGNVLLRSGIRLYLSDVSFNPDYLLMSIAHNNPFQNTGALKHAAILGYYSIFNYWLRTYDNQYNAINLNRCSNNKILEYAMRGRNPLLINHLLNMNVALPSYNIIQKLNDLSVYGKIGGHKLNQNIYLLYLRMFYDVSSLFSTIPKDLIVLLVQFIKHQNSSSGNIDPKLYSRMLEVD
jgi:hypothetical protein